MSTETVATAIANAVRARQGRLAFGVPGGGANLDLIGALEQAGVRFVLTHTESGGAIMAAAAAEITGVPGVCLATRGPGAASMVNGVAHAWLDRCPVLAVTDAILAADRLRIGHQRLGQGALFACCAKATAEIGDAGADETGAAAVRTASEPPWGPVHLDTVPDAPLAGPFPAAPASSPLSLLTDVRRRLAAAKRPLVIAGVGARRAEAAVGKLVEALEAPLLTTYKAKGAIPEDSSCAAGLFTGATIEGRAVESADLILMVGVDPVELIPAAWTYDAPVVAIGPWPVADPYFPVALEVVGAVGPLLEDLADGAAPALWRVQGQQFRQESLAALAWSPDAGGLSPYDVVSETHEVFGSGALVTVDAGAHMLVAMPLWEANRPQSVLISSGLATMGFALPAAIGAALACPGARVVCLTGDGGIGMCLAELETLARLRLPVTVVVIDDRLLSLISIKQRAEGHGGSAAVRYDDVDFAAVAQGFGIPGERVADRSALRAALRRAAAADGPALIDAITDPAAYPHVLAATRGRRVRRYPA